MFKRLLQLNVTIVDLSTVVVTAKVANLLSEFLKVVLALHHL